MNNMLSALAKNLFTVSTLSVAMFATASDKETPIEPSTIAIDISALTTTKEEVAVLQVFPKFARRCLIKNNKKVLPPPTMPS